MKLIHNRMHTNRRHSTSVEIRLHHLPKLCDLVHRSVGLLKGNPTLMCTSENPCHSQRSLNLPAGNPTTRATLKGIPDRLHDRARHSEGGLQRASNGSRRDSQGSLSEGTIHVRCGCCGCSDRIPTQPELVFDVLEQRVRRSGSPLCLHRFLTRPHWLLNLIK